MLYNVCTAREESLAVSRPIAFHRSLSSSPLSSNSPALSQSLPVSPLKSALTKRSSRNSFIFCTSVARPDLRIPKDLPRLNFRSQLLFFLHLPLPSHKCGKQTTYNPCRISTYEKHTRNSFRIRTYKKPGGVPAAYTIRSISKHSNLQTLQPSSFYASRIAPHIPQSAAVLKSAGCHWSKDEP